MKVAIDARKISDYGIGTYIRGLLHGLDEIGERGHVVLAPDDAAPHIPSSFQHVVFEAPNYSLREVLTVGRAAERAGADLLHAPHYVVPMTKLPVVVTIHDLIHLRHANPLARLYARTMLGRAVRKSARVLTVSEAVKSEILTAFRCDAQKVIVTSNGVRDAFRASAPVAKPERYFLFVGNDKPHKNVERLVDALAILRRSIADVSLVLTGADFERFHDRRGVIATRFVSDAELISLYRNAMAVVQPSLEEGFGLPAAEAMAGGTAVITSRAPALVEITGDAALHVDAHSPEEIAAAMRRIVEDDALRLSLGRQGIARSSEMTWRRVAERTRDAYRTAIS